MEHNYSKFGLVCQFDHILIILWYVICLTKKAELTQPNIEVWQKNDGYVIHVESVTNLKSWLKTTKELPHNLRLEPPYSISNIYSA